MKATFAIAVAGSMIAAAAAAAADKTTGPLSFKMNGIDGKEVDLAQYKGKVVMFVNVASKCGLTPQYKALQALSDKFEKDGLVVIGIPANEFGDQEPGTNEEIKKFCTTKYKVTFPLFSKVAVKGENQTPLYKFLTEKESNGKLAGEIKWNFEKFLVDRHGDVVARFPSKVKPTDPAFIEMLEKYLSVERADKGENTKGKDK